MKNKNIFWIIGIVVLIIIVTVITILRIGIGENSGEDNWIKDSRGVWIKHGNPSNLPDSVNEQQNAVDCALGLYDDEKAKETSFNSQCLGSCGDYSIDMVNVPRDRDDNLVENQCADYKEDITKHFIELDNYGEIVRIMD